VSGLGLPRVHFAQTTSTNDRLTELAVAGAPHGTLVTAAEQTAGRGRRGRSWSAPPGRALLMSLLLRDAPDLVVLRAAVAVAEAVGERAQIKWPNDVQVEDRKVAGILCETRPGVDWTIVGIGVNVAVAPHDLPPELARTAGTLGLEPHQVEPFLVRLLDRIDRTVALPRDELLTAWTERDALAGRTVQWDGGGGVAAGIDSEGRLNVDVDGGRVALDAGEVTLARPSRP
jgi:BirA family biotin operon repressor/biotin-[acetyl-CoA-carboxylase] ligase